MEVSKKGLKDMARSNKELKDMTLEELWALFPIVLVAHRREWEDWAREEIALLCDLLCGFSPVINHIGSTAIPTIWAKPIVDILVEVHMDRDMDVICNEGRAGSGGELKTHNGAKVKEGNGDEARDRIKALMEENGYTCMSESDGRMSFNKGYTPYGYAERVFHIHFHNVGDNDEVYFRDYLIAHPKVAKEYEALKLSLLPDYRNNRDGYTEAKTGFVRRITAMAKAECKLNQNK